MADSEKARNALIKMGLVGAVPARSGPTRQELLKTFNDLTKGAASLSDPSFLRFCTEYEEAGSGAQRKSVFDAPLDASWTPSTPAHFEIDESAASAHYAAVAKALDEGEGYDNRHDGRFPSRSPYLAGYPWGRGANFFPHYQHFLESGGIAKWKNSVMMNIRLNDIRDVDAFRGNGSFRVSFFLDTAFWVPWYDVAHFGTQTTVGQFTRYEPNLEFPEVDVEGGAMRWGRRDAEFSKGAEARQHEIQLGQLKSQLVKLPEKRSMKMVSVADEASHWPRLWRVLISDKELEELNKMPRAQKKQLTPGNENFKAVSPRLQQLFRSMDEERSEFLKFPSEGIAFVTYEISCEHRCFYELHDFPFDMHLLKIVVRLHTKASDPMSRIIIPCVGDKSFFLSSRVSEIEEYKLARNLAWEVTKEPVAYGGSQRLNASVIIKRKPEYFVRNYIFVIFLLTSSVFFTFLARPDDFNTRVVIIYTVLLSTIAFKYSGAADGQF